jgi:DNA uptake protein ComE-like DNA-binding protein
MGGLITLLSFVVALIGGGWFWLGFIIMLVVWANTVDADKKAVSQASTPDSPVPFGPEESAWSPSRPTEQGSEWSRKLTEVCSEYSAANYYAAELIPQLKLSTALKHYPLPGGGNPVALIDTTIFGSADCGMLIGEHGVSWHNWVVPTKISALKWEDLWKLTISIDGAKINIGNDSVFETSASKLDKNDIRTMLIRLQREWEVEYGVNEPPTALPASVEIKDSIPPELLPSESTAPTDVVRTDINSADFDSILELPGIGAADAKLLLQHRDSNGPLSSMDELVTVLSLKPHIVERLRPFVTFSNANSKQPVPPITPRPVAQEPKPTPMPPQPTGPVRAPIDF